LIRLLQMLVKACGLGVSVATGETLYPTEVFAASHSPAFAPSSSSAVSVSSHGHSLPSRGSGSKKGKESKRWGDQPVLLVLGIRLGLDGVNPIRVRVFAPFSCSSRTLPVPSFPPPPIFRPMLAFEYQSLTRSPAPLYFHPVRRHLGRSSFVIILLRWRTGDGLFYLDPHHSRPAVPLRPFAAEPAPSIPRSLLPHCTGTARTCDARCPPKLHMLAADPRAPNPAAGIASPAVVR
jgi:cysteine protease ATG4